MRIGLSSVIDAEMQKRIRAELSSIVAEHRVTILLAVESGSRAWGFPSKDSDYDVRFIYLRPLQDYLTVTSRRDVIERPVDKVLDINGWDIRKALQLLLRSNATLLEWLSSPVRYLHTEPVPNQLCELIENTADLKSLDYHYCHVARRSFGEIASGGNNVRLKARAAEAGTTPRIAGLDDLINRILTNPVSLAEQADRSGASVPNLKSAIAGKPRIRATSSLSSVACWSPESAARCGKLRRQDTGARADALFASIVLGR